jgi:hypothetical protein
MKDLKPNFKAKIEFPFKELFDPADPLAQWIANLARAANDLFLANRRLDESFKIEGSGHEAIYDIKSVASHAWELLKFLRASRSTEIETFINGLPTETGENYRKALEVFDTPALPQEKSFKSLLGSARDQASHYSDLDHKLLVQALSHLAEDDEDGEISTGHVYIGETKKDFYAEFASVLDYQLFLPTKGEDLEPFKKFVAQLQELAVPLICFSSEAVQAHLLAHHDQLTITRLDN